MITEKCSLRLLFSRAPFSALSFPFIHQAYRSTPLKKSKSACSSGASLYWGFIIDKLLGVVRDNYKGGESDID